MIFRRALLLLTPVLLLMLAATQQRAYAQVETPTPMPTIVVVLPTSPAVVYLDAGGNPVEVVRSVSYGDVLVFLALIVIVVIKMLDVALIVVRRITGR